MLQRVQTIFLIIVIACLGVFLATNSWSKTIMPDELITVNPYYITDVKGGMVEKKPIYYIATLAVLALCFTVFTIFQYKNRIRQMLLVAANSLIMGGAMALMVYHITQDANLMAEPERNGDFGIGFGAIFVAIISNWVANRFIKRDEKLVRSADRMR